MKKVVLFAIVIVISFAVGYTVCFFVQGEKHNKKLSSIRQAWYAAAIESREKSRDTFKLATDSPYKMWLAFGDAGGTAHTLESMNRILIEVGEPSVVLFSTQDHIQGILNDAGLNMQDLIREDNSEE